MNSINLISEHGLCSACGVCIGACPKKAISFKKDKTYYAVASNECIDCGICMDICTAARTDIEKLYRDNGFEKTDNILSGVSKKAYNLSIKDKELLLNSTSGGFVSGIVKRLLEDGRYNCAFLVNGYNNSDILKAERVTSYVSSAAKSRYLSVSMEKLIEEMLENRSERIIICATPCAVQAILNVVNKFKLNRENYLILGLFCDNTQSYAINEYFSSLSGKKIKEMFFRDKSLKGWPGDVKIVYENGKVKFFDSSKRRDVKKYYKLKRCFTCFDKLNSLADISVGDNYTKKNYNANGSNSIIIRTERGASAFDAVRETFDVYEIDPMEVFASQTVEKREQNLVNASIIEDFENITIYNGLHKKYGDEDRSALMKGLADTEKSLSEIKKEVRKEEVRRIFNKIKRKLRI